MGKFIKSRKFWITLIVLGVVWTGYFVTLQSCLVDDGDIVTLFTVCVSCTTLFGIASFGGMIWKDWIKSVHFNTDLFNGK